MKYSTIFYIKNLIKNSRFLSEVYMLYKKSKTDNERVNEIKEQINSIISQDVMPVFHSIEIETYNKCNNDCDFCPINKNLDTREHKYMDENLFYSIISQLKELDYRAMICMHSNNEPLLDSRIFDFVKHAKLQIPNCRLVMFTNGLLLNLEKFKKLIEYLDIMVIDHYYKGGGGKELCELRKNIENIAKYCLENEQLQNKVKIQLIDKHLIRNNRGSNSKNRKLNIKIKSSCIHPFAQFVVRSEGKISLCCCDARGEITLGDLNKEKIIDVWRGEKYQKIRKLIYESRSNISVCKNCDNFGPRNVEDYLAGYNIGKNWETIKKLVVKDG